MIITESIQTEDLQSIEDNEDKMDHNSPTCRVCMQTAIELIDFESDIEIGSEYTVLESFNFCTQLNATPDDDFPKNLCTICCSDLRIALDFIRKAQEADKLLRERKYLKEEELTEYMIIEVDNDRSEEGDLINLIYADNAEELQTKDKQLDKGPIKRLTLEDIDEDGGTLHDDNGQETQSKFTNFSCIQCSKSFDAQKSLERHLKNSHLDKLLCNVCGKTCTSRNSLNTHLLQHRGKKPFSCQYCNKKYFTRHGLNMHVASMHSDAKMAKFLCSVCGKEFATKQRLNIHNLTHTGEKNYGCAFCEKKFATPFRLRNHLRIHTGEKPYECNMCGIKFAQSNALKCHERIHTGEKPYECKICGKRFNQNTILKTHMTLHTGKTVQCPMCDKKFSRPSCLILHEREHTGEKPYACYKCPNKYKQKSHLDRHLDTHFGIKHKCNVCSKEYSKRSSLKIHMFEHSDEKPFQCPDCMIKFTRKDKYKSHLMKAHNKILVKQEICEVVKLENDTEAMISNDQEIIVEVKSNDDSGKAAADLETV